MLTPSEFLFPPKSHSRADGLIGSPRTQLVHPRLASGFAGNLSTVAHILSAILGARGSEGGYEAI